MVQVVTSRLFTAEAWVQSYASPRGICGEQSATGTSFSPGPSTNDPHVFIHSFIHSFMKHRYYRLIATDSVVK
jgi:hypothetical protein